MSKLLFALENDNVLETDTVKENQSFQEELSAAEELHNNLESSVHALGEVSDISDVVQSPMVSKAGLTEDGAEMVSIALESIAKRLNIKNRFNKMPSLEHFRDGPSRVVATKIALENVITNTIKMVWEKIKGFIKSIINFFKNIWNRMFDSTDKLESNVKEAKIEIQAAIENQSEIAAVTRVKREFTDSEISILQKIANEFEQQGKTDSNTVTNGLRTLNEIGMFAKRLGDTTITCISNNDKKLKAIGDVNKSTDNVSQLITELSGSEMETRKFIISLIPKIHVLKPHGEDQWVSEKLPGDKTFTVSSNFLKEDETVTKTFHVSLSSSTDEKQKDIHNVELLTPEQSLNLLKVIEGGVARLSSNIKDQKHNGSRITKELDNMEKLSSKLAEGAVKNTDSGGSEASSNTKELRDIYHKAAANIKFYLSLTHAAVSAATKLVSEEKKAYDVALLYVQKAPRV